MSKHSELIAITMQNIVSAFWDLYKKRKIENITVKNIMDKAGHNRTTFYNYFEDVYMVLEYIEDICIDHLQKEILDKFLTDKNKSGLLSAMIDSSNIYGEYISVLASDNGDPNFILKLRNAIKPIMSKMLINSKYNDIEQDITFEFMISAVLKSYSYWYSKKDRYGTDSFIKLLFSLMNDGIPYEFIHIF